MVRFPFSYLLATGLICILSLPVAGQQETNTPAPDTLAPVQDTLLIQPDTLYGLQDTVLQPPDRAPNVLDSSKVYYFFNNFEIMGPRFIQEIDTLVTNVENYEPTTRPGNYYARLGNPGLAHTSMVYNPVIKSGAKLGIHAFDKFLFHNDSIHHYWVGKPYTHIFFIQGTKKEQNLHIDHSQNVASWFNVGLRFRYVNSPGYYSNQEADDKNFVFKTRFQTRDYRYMVLANYIHNKLKLEENGGIRYDTVFLDNVAPDRRGIEVNLQNARNYYKENTYFVKQLFKLSKRHRFLSDDTTAPASFFNKLNPGNLALSTRITQRTYLYEQPTSDNNGYYNHTYDSLNNTYDSTYTYSIENQLSWTNGDNARQRLLTFNFVLRHLYAKHAIDSVEFTYNQIIPTAMLRLQVSDVMRLSFFGDLLFGETYGGDFNLIGKLELTTKFGNLKYELHNANQSVDRFYTFYRSNHFRWENDFQKQYFFINKASYNYKTFTAGVNLFAVENFVYSDTAGLPAQLNSNLQVLQLYIHKLFKLGDWSLDARIVYQNPSSAEGIRVPQLLGDASIFYTKALFKQAAILQTGFDVFYNTAYQGYAYMPATRDFHIQNQKEVGDYVYANVFLNLQIKRARLFLSYNNLGFILGDYRYITVPDYPMRDGGIRFGVSWMFYD